MWKAAWQLTWWWWCCWNWSINLIQQKQCNTGHTLILSRLVMILKWGDIWHHSRHQSWIKMNTLSHTRQLISSANFHLFSLLIESLNLQPSVFSLFIHTHCLAIRRAGRPLFYACGTSEFMSRPWSAPSPHDTVKFLPHKTNDLFFFQGIYLVTNMHLHLWQWKN